MLRAPFSSFFRGCHFENRVQDDIPCTTESSPLVSCVVEEARGNEKDTVMMAGDTP